jgi:hypothetical protein
MDQEVTDDEFFEYAFDQFGDSSNPDNWIIAAASYPFLLEVFIDNFNDGDMVKSPDPEDEEEGGEVEISILTVDDLKYVVGISMVCLYKAALRSPRYESLKLLLNDRYMLGHTMNQIDRMFKRRYNSRPDIDFRFQ